MVVKLLITVFGIANIDVSYCLRRAESCYYRAAIIIVLSIFDKLIRRFEKLYD